MSNPTPKYAVLLYELDKVLKHVPERVARGAEFRAALDGYRNLLLSPARSGRPRAKTDEIAVLSYCRTADELFRIEDQERNVYHLKGWDALLDYFKLGRKYAQTLFSQGRGTIIRNRNSVAYKVTRLGIPDDPAFLMLPPPPWAPGSREHQERERTRAIIAKVDARKNGAATRSQA